MRIIYMTGSMTAFLCACVPLSDVQDTPNSGYGCFGLPRPNIPKPIEYAAQKSWDSEDALSIFGERYVRFGLPRTAESLTQSDPPVRFRHVGEYDGVPIYVEDNKWGQMPKPLVTHLLLNADCGFQPWAQAHMLR